MTLSAFRCHACNSWDYRVVSRAPGEIVRCCAACGRREVRLPQPTPGQLYRFLFGCDMPKSQDQQQKPVVATGSVTERDRAMLSGLGIKWD